MAAGINTKGKMQITELDFDGIKNNLKTYLKGQSEFTDYDFEGSSMNILLDTLSYNTHYNAFMANMLANEMFLDTSQKRNSVTSHAKSLGYTPTSVKAPVAYLKVRVNDAKTPNIVMKEGHTFSSSANGIAYNFVNTEERIIQAESGIYEFGSESGIPVYEGTWTTTSVTVDLNNADQRFVIPNKNADISTLTVQVQTSSGDKTTTNWLPSESMIDIKKNTKAYFLQEAVDGLWEIYFGDDILGQALNDGNIVIMKYVVTNGTEANGIGSFISSESISGYHDISVVTLAASSGGDVGENIESIKHNAPFNYAAQQRVVTSKDYEAIISNLYSNVESISVWGGEYADPPVYGKVFISIRPKTGSKLTTSTKLAIIDALDDYKVASITPVILDPEITKVIPNISFKYNHTTTGKSKEDLAALVSKTLVTWSDNNLEKHESIFRYSKFVSLIDSVDTSILSNITTILMSKTFRPTINTKTQYTIAFNNSFFNPLQKLNNEGKGLTPIGVIYSTGFKYVGDNRIYYLEDDGVGNVKAYHIANSDKVYKGTSVGKVDYSKGTIVLSSENIASVENYDGAIQHEIQITARPNSNDIIPVRNQVLELDAYNLSVSGEADSIVTGTSDGASQYTTAGSFR
jgi:hypothetical protein